jgi:Tol biopolymer transport system component
MAISPGTRLGNYEVIAPLGAGGMGEVYRATDLRLNRPVAVKILPADFAADADRVRRFEAEARAASALNHPHIVSIFETGRTDSVSFIAMELVEGLPLDQWVQRQRPGLERVLQVVAQTADALSAAHQAGIVHRDLKPANLIVTAQGYVKVVDFGLAKITTGSAHDGETQTVVGGHTTLGAVIGTAAYMSPEQALGRSVDSRTDIFSLGTILFEAATGRQPFSGASTLELLHAVVHDPQPGVRDIEPKSPPVLDWILAKALAKDPDERYQSMRELSIDVRHLLRALQGGRDESTPAVQPADTSPVWRRLATGAALFMTAAVAAWIGRAIARPAATETARPPVVTLTPLTSDPGYEGEATFSADGQTIAYVSDRTGNFEIFLRQVSGGPSINLTSHAADDVQPAFSPDGRQIAFVSSRSGTSDVLFTQPAVPLLGGDVWVMPALGGSPRRLAEKGNFPSWSRDGASLLYTGGPWFGQRLYRVDASGAPPSEIPIDFPADRRVPGQLTYPREAPDGRWILLVGTPDDIYVVPAAGGRPTAIARGSMAIWGPDGASIIYSNADVGRNDSLWRLPFDKASGRVGAPPEPLTIDRGADLHPAMSADGRLVAFTASEVVSNIERIPFDPETGRQTGPSEMVTAGKDPIYFFTSAPDGSAVAFALARGSGRNLWRSAADGTAQQLTWQPRVEDGGPRWSPDGRTILFSRRSTESGAPSDIWTMEAEGGSPRRILGEIGLTGLFAWTFDGRGIVSVSPKDRQLYVTDLSTRNSRRLTQERGVMPIIVTSRDGKWAVYQSVQSGDVDLYAVPLEGGVSRPVVATSHKEYHPMLSPSGRWLYYLRDHNVIYRVPGPAQDWRQASPEKVIDFRLPSGAFIEDPQITPDGRYLLYARGRFSGDLWLASFGQ